MSRRALACSGPIPFYNFVPSFGINVLVALAGLGALSLFALQRTQREYLWLGLYLLVVSTNALLVGQQDGVLPVSANLLVADPLIYVAAVILIEFTFSFVRRRLICRGASMSFCCCSRFCLCLSAGSDGSLKTRIC